MIKVSKNWFKDYYDPYLTKTTLGSRMNDANAVKEVAFIKELFRFDKGQTLLDIPCGTGRHSIKLAKTGLNVTGLDISRACLIECRKGITPSLKKKISFKQADIRELSDYHGQYDYVINMCTSLGYFSTTRENQKALRQMVKCLIPDGRLLIQIVNRDWLLDKFEPTDWVEADDHFLLSRRVYNSKTHYLLNDWVFIDKKSGRIRRYPHRLRVYSRAELSGMMKTAGLSKIRAYGDLLGGRLSKTDSRWMYLTGEKR